MESWYSSPIAARKKRQRGNILPEGGKTVAELHFMPENAARISRLPESLNLNAVRMKPKRLFFR
ncbi:hypothetical protein EIKCOROL_00851 [Eikenella corrodens ATCC 23834]|uniref:Uncharacterized protein n=1 Tax=Eikenella corrodens ATCC 23834 TaxID=546274 RepID=C0DU20_EIKCO|nr:hypothetical protein EIKCOROL_00851 [Eikenella corrodens ATCC 23834]